MTPPITRYDPKNPDGVALAYQIAHEFAAHDVHGEDLQKIYETVSTKAHEVVQQHRETSDVAELPLADAMARAVPSPIQLRKMGFYGWPVAVRS